MSTTTELTTEPTPELTRETTPASTATGGFPTRTVSGVCAHDCPDSCGWLVTVEDRPDGAFPVRLRGNPAHPFSRGELCPKVNRYLDRVLSPDRITTPLRRVGAKGEGRFEPITWEAALSEIATRWHDVIERHGRSAIVPFFDAGNQSELAMGFGNRLFEALGATKVVGSICGLVAGVATALTYGTPLADDPTEVRFAKTIILWGTNTKLTNRHLWPFIEEARADGATVVVIDPIRTATAEAADVFIQPLPGTDVALALAIMHVLVRDGLIDRDYVDAHASGYDELAAHVAAWTPQRAAEVCAIGADEIEALAARYAGQQPSFIRTLIGAEHAEHGAMFFRTVSMLPVLIGAWNHRGGGFARSIGSYSGRTLRSLDVDALAGPGERRQLQMNHIGRWLDDPAEAVHALIVWNTNPVVTFPNTELIQRGLRRHDLFTVVHEQFLTDTAAFADIVLPATTQIESDDITHSWGSPHVTYNHAAIAPIGESVSNSELFRRLATALGLDHPALHESDEALIASLFHDDGPVTLERLLTEGTVAVEIGPQRFRDGGFGTPDGKAALASAELERAGLGRVPDWTPSHEGAGGDPELAARFPFLLATPKTHTRFLNSSYSHLPGHGDREGGPFVELCGSDAAALGLADGALAVVWNDRGRLELPVRISNRVRPGLAAVPFGWNGPGRIANTLTNDTLTRYGGGVAYNDTRVAIAPADRPQR